jgi:tRNA A37 threonylcarbamoyladenosine dehydratase
MHAFQRTELLLGEEGWSRLQCASVMVVGIGGVGSFAVEALVRAGVGRLTLVDFDQVCLTNLNRQLHATRRTVGAAKVGVMAERARSINPKSEIVAEQCFFEAENAGRLLAPGFDCVVDAIDNVTAKIALLEACHRRGQRVVASMGAGGRIDPTRIRVTDISRTEKDPLAKVVRNTLRTRGVVSGIECVWTDEEPRALDAAVADAFHCICPWGDNDHHSCSHRNVVQGTVPWMPAIFGLTLAGVVVNRMLGLPVLSSERMPPLDRPRRKKQRAARKSLPPLPARGPTAEPS